MTAKALTLTKLIIDSMWVLATEWHLPGFIFNFATLALGCILIVHIVLPLLGDFLVHFGVKPFDTSVDSSDFNSDSQPNTHYVYGHVWPNSNFRKYGD